MRQVTGAPFEEAAPSLTVRFSYPWNQGCSRAVICWNLQYGVVPHAGGNFARVRLCLYFGSDRLAANL